MQEFLILPGNSLYAERNKVFLLHSGMKGILEEREGTKEFLWRERFDTHDWLFEAHLKLHV